MIVYIIQFLNFLQAQARKLKKADLLSHTITVMLVGIPNVGKSALVKALHHIGRITAEGISYYYLLFIVLRKQCF